MYRLVDWQKGALDNSNTIPAPINTQNWNRDLIGNWANFTDNGISKTTAFSETYENEATMVKFSWLSQPEGQVHGCAKQMTKFGTNSLAYDANGNTTQDGNRELIYDGLNRLIEIWENGEQVAKYAYSANNQRVYAKTNFQNNLKEIVYVYDAWQVIEEQDFNGNPLKTTVYGGQYIDEVILTETSSQTLYHLHDYRFAILAVADANGNILEEYEYMPYGERNIANALTDVSYTGQKLDDSGYHYFRNRYYNAKIGSFISRDPLEYVDGYSMYLGYFGVNGVDPWGNYVDLFGYIKRITSTVDHLRVIARAVNNIYSSVDMSFIRHYYSGNSATFDLVQRGLLQTYLMSPHIQKAQDAARLVVSDEMRKKLPCTSGEVKLTRLKFKDPTGNFFIKDNKAFGPSFYSFLGSGYVSANYKAKWKTSGVVNGTYTLKFESVIYFYQKDEFTDILAWGHGLEKIHGSLKALGTRLSNEVTLGKPFDIVAYWNIDYDKEYELEQP